MAYSDFTLDELKVKFNVKLHEEFTLFHKVQPYKVSDMLMSILEDNVPLAQSTFFTFSALILVFFCFFHYNYFFSL